jgi:hypothetical protein
LIYDFRPSHFLNAGMISVADRTSDDSGKKIFCAVIAAGPKTASESSDH